MSQTLEALLKTEITTVIKGFGTDEYTGPLSPTAAQDKFINELSAGIARAVFTYLQTNVTYIAPAIPAAPLPVVPLP